MNFNDVEDGDDGREGGGGGIRIESRSSLEIGADDAAAAAAAAGRTDADSGTITETALMMVGHIGSDTVW